jgi:hypothetical protein
MVRLVGALFVGLLFLTSAVGQHSNSQPDETKSTTHLESILAKMKGRQIASVEILWMDPNSESRATVEPATLDEQYFRRLQIKRFYGGRIEKTLISALSRTRLSKANPTDEGDVRWAIKLYGRGQKKPVHKIYLDGSGRSGILDGIEISFNSSLKTWLDDEFGRVFTDDK